MADFRMGSLDHIHVVIPDRKAAAQWYREQLGFEPVEEYAAWTKVEGGRSTSRPMAASRASRCSK